MRQVTPYRTAGGARRALDNGGRILNLFTKPGDGIVEASELAKAAGVFSSGDKAFVYLDMSLSELSPGERQEMVSLLPPNLRAKYIAHRPQVLAPSVVEREGSEGDLAIVSGYPVFVEDRTQFKGFIVMVTPVVMFIPIMDQFDVYEVYDTPDMIEPRTVVATMRGSKRLDGGQWRFGGMLRELQFEDKTGKAHGLYLETMYYSQL